jgi:hypothetical protein
MQDYRKRWLSLGVALASGISAGAMAADSPAGAADMQPAMMLAQAATGEGEGGDATPASLKTDDVAFLSRLGLIRGHLLVGYELYRQGHAAMANMHMKHPRDELYAGLVPAIEHRGGKRFDQPLSKLADRVESASDQGAVDRAYQELEAGIKSAEAVTTPSLKASLLSIVQLLNTAGEEYALGVEDGKLVNAHEYQDAFGFTEIAKRRLTELSPAVRSQSPTAVEQAGSLLAELADLWPTLSPGDEMDGDASRLHGAASRIEILALGL